MPDVNVWVALTVSRHDRHNEATAYWEEESIEPITFCRTTALGLVRVCSGKNSTGGHPMSVRESWLQYRSWRSDTDVAFSEEAAGVEHVLDTFIQKDLVTAKNSPDAYLAAFAVAAGLRLVTFDRDFERFPGLDLLRL